MPERGPEILKGTLNKQNILVKFIISKHLSVSDWMESVILIVGYRGLHGLDHGIRDTIVKCETPFIHFSNFNKPLWALKWKGSRDNHSFTN